MNQLGSNFEFLYTFSPYQFLKDDQNNLDTLLNRIELGEFLNLLFTASPPDFDVICNCLKNRHQKNSNYAPLMRAFVVDSASLMNLFLAMEMTNYGDYIPALAARLGFENLNIEDAKEELNRYVYGNNGNGSNLKILLDELYKIDEGFRDCGPSVSNFLFKLHTDQPNKLIELLMVIPDLRDMFYRTASSDGFDCSYSFSHDDMASLMSNNYSEFSWNKLIEAFGTNSILSYFVNNQNSYFMNQAVMYNKSILTNTQQNQNLYGGNYGGLENYFSYIRNYFGQGLYDQITAGFMQQSSVYTDSLRLEEWHIYGSARIGIYQTNKAMAQRTVRIENGVTTQLSNTHIEQLSLSRFYTERGAKRYELTNHLGDVLTVVTDKKLPVCSSNNISCFIADVVSATDYSPFGAPLAERTWQGSEYRFGFNTQERDDEIAGPGNIMTAEYWEYDTRLGRRWNVDPLANEFPFQSPYSTLDNNPLNVIDPTGESGKEPKSKLYKVQKGNTLSNIAKANNTTVGELLKLNPSIKDKNKIYEGQTIYLPLKLEVNQNPLPPNLRNEIEKIKIQAAEPQKAVEGLIVVPISNQVGIAILVSVAIVKIGNELISNPSSIPVIKLPNTSRIISQFTTALQLSMGILLSKGGKKNVWPDGQYPKPNPKNIDWRKGDQELADEITGKDVPQGGGTPNNLIKKWFRDKRPR